MRLVVNPAAGRGAGGCALGRLRELAGEQRIQVRVSQSAAHLVSEARRAAAEGEEGLLVAGGDGTFHLAIQGLTGTQCAMGLIPLGTGNDLAAILGVPRRLDEALRVACEAPVRRVDLGRARVLQAGEASAHAKSDDLLPVPASRPTDRRP